MVNPTVVRWIGQPAPPRVAALLRNDGIHVTRRKTAADNELAIVSTRNAARVPPRDDASRWLWISATDVPERMQVEAVLRGAYDVISLRDDGAPGQILERLHELLTPVPPIPASDLIVTESSSSKRMIQKIARVAPTSMPVLLTGETGTGKEVMARLLHAWSRRHARPLVPINCAAIPNELMEAELFGYARGAFSGAVQRYDGQLMAAEGGTVFLDEIDDTPIETQVKLLRVLEDRVVSRLGENVWHQVDFRMIAATNRDLRQLVDAGRFGIDLYERLAIVTIQLPPLRARLEDCRRWPITS